MYEDIAQDELNAVIYQPINGFKHNHTRTGFNVFSPADVETVYQVFVAGTLFSPIK